MSDSNDPLRLPDGPLLSARQKYLPELTPEIRGRALAESLRWALGTDAVVNAVADLIAGHIREAIEVAASLAGRAEARGDVYAGALRVRYKETAEAVAAERERCATVADGWRDTAAGRGIAESIREGGP